MTDTTATASINADQEDLTEVTTEELDDGEENQDETKVTKVTKDNAPKLLRERNEAKKKLDEYEKKFGKLDEEEDVIEKKVQEQLAMKEVSNKLESVKSKLDEEQIEEFNKQFELLVGDKKLTPEQADTFINATL